MVVKLSLTSQLPFNSLASSLSHLPTVPFTDQYPQASTEDETLLFAPRPFKDFIVILPMVLQLFQLHAIALSLVAK